MKYGVDKFGNDVFYQTAQPFSVDAFLAYAFQYPAAAESFCSASLSHVVQVSGGTAKETLSGSGSLSQVVETFSGTAKETLKSNGGMAQVVQVFSGGALERFLATASLEQILEVLAAEASGASTIASWSRRRRAFLASRGRGI